MVEVNAENHFYSEHEDASIYISFSVNETVTNSNAILMPNIGT